MSDLVRSRRDGSYFHHCLVDRVTEKFQKNIPVVPGGLEILDDVKSQGLPMALVSASPRILVQAALDALPTNIFQLPFLAQR